MAAGNAMTLATASLSESTLAHLGNLTAQATLQYSLKDYCAAAELYAHATELQAEINGEMSSQNADLLYAYGRCLYHVAVKNSDVLGTKVAGEKQPRTKQKPSQRDTKLEHVGTDARQPAEGVVAEVLESRGDVTEQEADADNAIKPYFQFKGDENFDTSDEEADEEAPEEGDEEENDFANAYEVLDLARILILQKMQETEVNSDRGEVRGDPPDMRPLQERLADTYDLQAEISLEGERFSSAAVDLSSALALKTTLYPQESSLVAEAHYKLSLALEFSSVIQQRNEKGDIVDGVETQINYEMRKEAEAEMEKAIASCKVRIQKEETTLRESIGADEKGAALDLKAKDIEDVKEMVSEMKQRLAELRLPPVSINDSKGTRTIDDTNPLAGILGAMLGESPEAQTRRLEAATSGAKDLSGLVKKKKPVGGGSAGTLLDDRPELKAKRKADAIQDDDVRDGQQMQSKRQHSN